jgi:hypothetical protein
MNDSPKECHHAPAQHVIPPTASFPTSESTRANGHLALLLVASAPARPARPRPPSGPRPDPRVRDPDPVGGGVSFKRRTLLVLIWIS